MYLCVCVCDGIDVCVYVCMCAHIYISANNGIDGCVIFYPEKSPKNVMSDVRLCHVAHMNASCGTYECVISHI